MAALQAIEKGASGLSVAQKQAPPGFVAMEAPASCIQVIKQLDLAMQRRSLDVCAVVGLDLIAVHPPLRILERHSGTARIDLIARKVADVKEPPVERGRRDAGRMSL